LSSDSYHSIQYVLANSKIINGFCTKLHNVSNLLLKQVIKTSYKNTFFLIDLKFHFKYD